MGCDGGNLAKDITVDHGGQGYCYTGIMTLPGTELEEHIGSVGQVLIIKISSMVSQAGEISRCLEGQPSIGTNAVNLF